jgi:hypothetical protein
MTNHSKRLDQKVAETQQTPKVVSDADRFDRRFRVEGDPLEALKAVTAGLSERNSWWNSNRMTTVLDAEFRAVIEQALLDQQAGIVDRTPSTTGCRRG